MARIKISQEGIFMAFLYTTKRVNNNEIVDAEIHAGR